MISEEYSKLLAEKHQDHSFGTRDVVPPILDQVLKSNNVQTVVDFGCGKGNLVRRLKNDYSNLTVFGFDPANPEFASIPDKVDLIFSTDVLEHVEPQLLDKTLSDLCGRCRVQYHLIACHYASNILPDGRNAHLIVRTPDWWQNKFYELGWKIIHENVYGFIKVRPPRPIAVTHYEILLVSN